MIDDGATANEVFELVTDDAMADASCNEWDNGPPSLMQVGTPSRLTPAVRTMCS